MTTDEFALHRLVFTNDAAALAAALEGSTLQTPHASLSELCRGQTPLSLAASLGHLECTQVLLAAGASTLQHNKDGWSPYHEATSVGDRVLMEAIFRRRREELAVWFNSKGKGLLEQLSKNVQDISFEMNWSFRSFIPFVSQLCPSDNYKIYKKGSSVRIDTTLVGFERLNWLRGDISIILRDDGESSRLVICDHQRRLVQQVWPRDFKIDDQGVEEELSVSLNTNINAPPDIDWSSFSFKRAQKGFLAFKYDRIEKVGPWNTNVWNVDGFEVSSRVRKEHLSVNPLPEFKLKEIRDAEKAKKRAEKEEKRKLEAAKPKKTGGFVIANPDSNPDYSDDSDAEFEPQADDGEDEETRIRNYRPGYRNIQDPSAEDDYKDWRAAKRAFRELAEFRATLDKPAPSGVSFEEFFDAAKKDEYLHVGRPVDIEEKKRAFRATLWMYEGTDTGSNDAPRADNSPIAIQSDEFPIKISDLIPVLDLIGMGTNEHIRSLKEFFNVQLPNGFPVQIELPIGMLPLSAVIRFQNIHMRCEDPEGDLFKIPGKADGYREGEVVRGNDDDF
ncbi:GPCR-chaperone-domain-containing protein [Entophlyctis helioformis]|nr:GPCR-chaperone-domain-containing protein [Entophlyctis helioformis]